MTLVIQRPECRKSHVHDPSPQVSALLQLIRWGEFFAGKFLAQALLQRLNLSGCGRSDFAQEGLYARCLWLLAWICGEKLLADCRTELGGCN